MSDGSVRMDLPEQVGKKVGQMTEAYRWWRERPTRPSDEFVAVTDLLRHEGLVVVHFYARLPPVTWSSTLGEIAVAQRGRIVFTSLDVNRFPIAVTQHHVGTLPTLIVFRDGSPVKRVEGFRSRAQLFDDLADFLS